MNEREVRALQGLDTDEVARRMELHGPNELPSAKPRSVGLIAKDVLCEPMILLLLGGGAIYFALGDVGEALVLLSFVFIVVAIEFMQERKTERALEALRDLSSPRALVIRDGVQTRIAGREVVPGDLVVLAEGDRVPADGILLYASNVTVDESLLTGESVPVRKRAAEAPDREGTDGEVMPRPGGDDQPSVFSGTLVVAGQGVAQIVSTGSTTAIGRIGSSLRSIKPEKTRLQRETDAFVKTVALIGFCCCAIVVVAYGLTRHDWLGGLLAGIALAMAILPEEFPVVLTIFLSLGAWRMSRHQVLTRRTPSIETLGSATVLCVDKTGTLTQNRMTIVRIVVDETRHLLDADRVAELPEAVHTIVEYGILACQRDPFDPMEKAFTKLRDEQLSRTEHVHRDWNLVHEYPLSTSLLALSHVWTCPDDDGLVVAAKGAPEAIMDLCHMAEAQRITVGHHVDAMASDGLRILAVARAIHPGPDLPPEQHDFTFEYLGLVGLADPVRPTVPAAVGECRQAGIRVVMITGDYPATALSIAETIGLDHGNRAITGPELEACAEADLSERLADVNVFARVVPEQKLRIVQALKARGEVVAMTGDGVNDAPALKAADIGIAMGQRGTDVAREASDLVLLDDDFTSIVSAVRMGRRIYDNLEKAMAYILSIHVPIAGISLIPVLLKWPLILMPVHIAFLELIIDPACSVAFEAEPEEATVMTRPPRPRDRPLFNRYIVGLSLLQGASVLAIVTAVYAISRHLGHGENECRALTFVTLVVANVALILTNRSWSRTIFRSVATPNRSLWYVVFGAVLMLVLALSLPMARQLFRFSPLQLHDLLPAVLGGVFSILWFELLKWAGVTRGRNRRERAA